MDTDTTANSGSERRDNWYVIKGIPVAVLLALTAHGATFAWYLSGLNSQVQQQGKEQAADRVEWRAGLAKVEVKLEALANALQGNSVPTALNQRRIEDIERVVSRLEARVADNERRLSSESARARATRER